MWFRFVIQPLVAGFFGIRSGLQDAREGRPPFFWSLLTQQQARKRFSEEAFKDIGRVFLAAMVLDIIYQLIVLRGIYLLELLFTATALAVVPYILIRGPVNRIARRFHRSAKP